MDVKCTRKSCAPVKVYCLPAERAHLRASAAAAGHSVSRYLLCVGMGYRMRGVFDQRNVDALLRVNGDLGRLGGLLKLWLANDERTAAFGKATLQGLLAKIEATQDELLAVARTVLIPRADDERF